MSPNRSAPVASRPVEMNKNAPEAASTGLNRVVSPNTPTGNPKLAYGGGLVVLAALVALGVTQVDFDAAPAPQPVAQAPVDVKPAPGDIPAEDIPEVTALPSAPIGSDRTIRSAGSVEPVLPAASELAASASCDAAGSCSVTATFTLNVSASSLEVVVAPALGAPVAARHVIDVPGRAGVREATFTVAGDSRCFWVEAANANGQRGAASNALCVDASGSVGPAPAAQ